MANKASLPTLDRLQATIPEDLDVRKEAEEWLQLFEASVKSQDIEAFDQLFVEDAYFRDILAMTWDFRTFEGIQEIKVFLKDRLAEVKPRSFKLDKSFVSLEQPYPDLAWIQAMFTFETEVGLASGVFRLVPLAGGQWKAHTVFTNLEDLKGFPEKKGILRNNEPNHGKWLEKRRVEREFEGREPTALVIGGGQSGLDIAARLKLLDVSTLVIEKFPRVGDMWRNRYAALCLHDPVWYDHMPYLPFPPTWPVWTPALKLADWLESYAHTLELDVWTSSTVTSVSKDSSGEIWNVTVKRADGTERVFHPKHVVFATGVTGGDPKMPAFVGAEDFEGKILHSSQHEKALDHAGKKVVVLGACTSGHDICADFYDSGIDITMIQRGETYIMSTKEGMPRQFGIYTEDGPPTDIADRLSASFPNKLLKLVNQRVTKDIAQVDAKLLYDLKKCGFRTTLGEDDSGFLLLAFSKAGGYYLDVGASQMIIDGKIKLKNDSAIERLTKTGIKFQDGSELPADVIVCATGFGDARDPIRKIVGDEIINQCKPLWGLDEEAELNGVWRDTGVKNLWSMMGNLALCRFHSKHLALQIKAIETGVFGARYSLKA